MTSPTDWNYYEVLDVPNTAPQSQIYDAYLKAKETYSLSNPKIFDVFNAEEANAWLQIIEEAYSIVGHPNTRRIYDQELNVTIPNVTIDAPAQGQVSDALTQDNIPEGHGQTPISVYPLDQSMEDLIEKQDIYDGLFLKKIRNYKKIDLQSFSQKTCIAIRHLYAIENNNFSVLPAAVFVRGYIIQYCRLLDLPEKQVVTSFMSLLSNEQ
ncbi:MAG: helix-turn-helix domain-containing protein [Bdellovibrionales bacterium]|nr:helix-turn-helix domain-containing protein [Bdellovibrionales bacterium]NQZ19490.1 helix-turn-helix domain-containing protein [Bdellovibrionales bacterium]